MTSVGQRHRTRGARREPRPTSRTLLGASVGVHPAHIGENRLNMQQMHALEHIYSTHPAVQAARTVLHGQLLSGGLQVTRGGERVELKPSFAAHLAEHWLPFAKDVVDSFLKFGLAVFSFEVEPEDTMSHAVKKIKKEGQGTHTKAERKLNLVPIVPPLGTYDVGLQVAGRAGYMRKYQVYSQAPGMTTEPDTEAFVHVRQAPDGTGNVNSPVASVFELGSFVSALTDLAYVAEVARSTPQITTQMRKPEKQSTLDAGALFFDSESRAVATGQGAEESQDAARHLEMQSKLCALINKIQTQGRDGVDNQQRETSGMRQPPEIPPKLFVIPKARARVQVTTATFPRDRPNGNWLLCNQPWLRQLYSWRSHVGCTEANWQLAGT